MTFMCAEGCLLNVINMHPHLVITGTQIKFGEKAGAFQLIQQLLDDRNWKFIFHCLLIQGTVIYTKAPCVVMLLNQQDRGREG